MQNTAPASRIRYRERLTPSLWLLAAMALIGPMVAIVFVPVGSALAVVLGLAVVFLILIGAVSLSSKVAVTDQELHAGRAHIDVRWLGAPAALTGEAARLARGAELPARGWHLIRGGIDGVVVVPLTDPDDPVPSWTISTRTPDRLAAAIIAAQAERID